jgi:hypothetical protein
MLIKLLEMCEELTHVEKAESHKKRYSIREVVINSDFIVTMRQDLKLEEKINDNNNLVEGLNKNEKFTRICLNKGNISNDLIIVGSLEQTLRLLDINNKKVIKG